MDQEYVDHFEQELAKVIECYGHHEREVLRRLPDLLGELPERSKPELMTVLMRAAGRLPPLVRAIESYPITPEYQQMGRRERNANSLIDGLCHTDWSPVDFAMPTGAVMGRALVIARINLLKALDYTLELADSAHVKAYREELEDLIDDAIFSKLAEELLIHSVSNPRNDPELRRSAAYKLLSVWNNWVRQPVAEFPSVLLSAWKARRKMRTIYGSLFGVQEMLALIRAQCEPDFVQYFTRDQVTRDEAEAFREFIFGIPYEELQQLQEYMHTNGVAVLSRDDVCEIVDRSFPTPPSGDPSAEEVFASYWRRSIRAEYRALSSAPGPQKTAEGYMIEVVLKQDS